MQQNENVITELKEQNEQNKNAINEVLKQIVELNNTLKTLNVKIRSKRDEMEIYAREDRVV